MNSTNLKKTNILGKTLPEMEELLVNLGQKSYRAKQILKWIHQRGICNFDDMTDLSKELRNIMQKVRSMKLTTSCRRNINEK